VAAPGRSKSLNHRTFRPPARKGHVYHGLGHVYHGLVSAAFQLLRDELCGASGPRDPETQRAARGLRALEKRYRARRYSSAELGAVRVRSDEWSPQEKEAVLRQLAKVIRDGESAQDAYGHAQLLKELWEYGNLPRVDDLCAQVAAAAAQGHADEIKWLLDTWTPRHAAGVVSAATSLRLGQFGRQGRTKIKARPRRSGVKTVTRSLVPRRG
jgi:hypothetical protein